MCIRDRGRLEPPAPTGYQGAPARQRPPPGTTLVSALLRSHPRCTSNCRACRRHGCKGKAERPAAVARLARAPSAETPGVVAPRPSRHPAP
eukprot:138346-Alexandrium_andersonii.AAC.1